MMSARILPWTVAGFVLMIATGLLLFYAIPVRSFHSLWFRAKVLLMGVAAINIFIFHARVERGRDQWDLDVTPPIRARISAAISLAAWAGVIITGRMIAYDWFDCDKPQSALVHGLTGCPVGSHRAMSLYHLFEALEASPVGDGVKNSVWLFPAIEAAHLLALALLGGAVLMLDLRLLGVGLTALPPSAVERATRPWLIAALATMIVTGVLMGLSEALKLYDKQAFWVKMIALALALMFTFAP